MIKNTPKSSYYTLAYPYFTCGNGIWGNSIETYMSPLIILQKMIIRILIGNISRLARTKPFFREQIILKFNVLRWYQITHFMSDFIKGGISEVFNDMFIYNRLKFTIIISGRRTCIIFIRSAPSSVKEVLDMKVLSYGINIRKPWINCTWCFHSKHNWNCYCDIYKL